MTWINNLFVSIAVAVGSIFGMHLQTITNNVENINGNTSSADAQQNMQAATSASPTMKQLSTTALEQISALEQRKSNLTPVEQKIDSQLLYYMDMQSGTPITREVPVQRVDISTDAQGRVLVDITATDTDALLQYIQGLGGEIISNFPQFDSIRAGIPINGIKNVAAMNEVRFIAPAVQGTIN